MCKKENSLVAVRIRKDKDEGAPMTIWRHCGQLHAGYRLGRLSLCVSSSVVSSRRNRYMYRKLQREWHVLRLWSYWAVAATGSLTMQVIILARPYWTFDFHLMLASNPCDTLSNTVLHCYLNIARPKCFMARFETWKSSAWIKRLAIRATIRITSCLCGDLSGRARHASFELSGSRLSAVPLADGL